MKALLKILAVSFTIFMVLAIAQEREAFRALLPGAAPQTVTQPPEEGLQEEAAAAVRQFLIVLAHLYTSGGDQRFADRLPAAPHVVDEAMADLNYLRHNNRIQEMHLIKSSIREVERVGDNRILARGDEYWTIRDRWAGGEGYASELRSQVLTMEYRLEHDRSLWRVVGWEPVERVVEPATDVRLESQ